MSQVSLLDEYSKATDPSFNAATKALSFYGFTYEGGPPSGKGVPRLAVGDAYTHDEGQFFFRGKTRDGYFSLVRVSETLYVITPKRSLLIVPSGDAHIVSHFYKEGGDFDDRIKERFHKFSKRIGIEFKDPHWVVVCGRVRDGVI